MLKHFSLPPSTRILKALSLELTTLRHKGHSHWQNVKSSKQAGDRLKAVVTSGYCNRIKILVRGSSEIYYVQSYIGSKTVSNQLFIVEHGPDPKSNIQLERLITDATNNNVPKDTLMRAIQQAVVKSVTNYLSFYIHAEVSYF